MQQKSCYKVEVAGITRELPLMEVAPGVQIAILNILGDTELVHAAAKELSLRIPAGTQCLVTAEAKSIPLIYALSLESGLPYVVLRKSYKPYMGNAITAITFSITTNAEQSLYLDEKDQNLITGKKIAIVDDVVSTGSTLQGIEQVLQQLDTTTRAVMAIFTEGDKEKWKHAVALGHLPVFRS